MSPRRRRHDGRADRAHVAAGPAVDVVRLARAALFAAVCVATTTLGHTLMAGEALPWWAVASALAGAGPGGWWLTGRERAALTVVGTTVAAQLLLHLLFSLASRQANRAAAPWPTGGTLHDVHAHVPPHVHPHVHAHASGGTGSVAGAAVRHFLPDAVHGGSAGMVLAHVLAAVVCGLWLWRGEAAAHRTGRALAAVLFIPLRRILRALFDARPAHGAPPWRAVSRDGAHWRPTGQDLRHVVVRRGPPGAGRSPRRLSPDPSTAPRF